MSDLPLRTACKHGRYERHRFGTVDPPCPGGRDIPIDYEMVSAWLATLTPNEGRDVARRLHEQADAAARLLLAAIGDGE